MVAVSHPKLHADEFESMLVELGEHHELIEGEVVVKMPDGIAAARTARAMTRALEDWLMSPQGRGEVLQDCFVRLDDGNHVGPDVAWYSTAPSETQGAIRSRVPDLVVEILVPSTRDNDLGAKLDVYARVGVPEYWVVDPDACTAAIARFADGERALQPTEVLGSVLLPGFALALADVLPAS